MVTPATIWTSCVLLFIFITTSASLMGVNIIIIWVIMEVSLMLSLPVIISFKSAASAESALKYFIIQIISGSLSGVLCPSLKKMLSYSSVAHTGWLVVLAAQSTDWVTYLLGYSVILYWGLSWLNTNTFKTSFQMFRQSGVSQVLTLVAMMSLSGFPPTLGFYLKMLGLTSLMGASMPLSLLLVLSLTASVYYYFTLFLHAWLLNYKPHSKYNSSLKYIVPGVLVVLIPFII